MKLKILTKEDWEGYQLLFQEIYPNFFDNLKSKYAKLTEGEIRLIILLFMGFSKEDQSNMIGVSPESIRKNTYRLRKKLNVDSQEDLIKLISNL